MFWFAQESFPDKVADLVRSHGLTKPRVKKKLLYFARYLEDICASVVIVEKGYTDQSLQSDRWAFAPYDDSTVKPPCARLHFFRAEEKEDSKKNKNIVACGLEETLSFLRNFKGKYLGAMVIHLERTKIVGTTCLSTYPVGKNVETVSSAKSGQTENREIPAVMEYPVNLVGHKMSVKSIGFREQDGVTSACATCSLWSLFQATSRRFQHHSLSPGKITALALGIEQHDYPLPAKLGLTLDHMEKAILSVPGIRPFNATHPSPDEKTRKKLNSILNFALPVLNYGIPVILQIEKIVKEGKKPPVHAICLIGYNYADGQDGANGQDHKTRTQAREITSLIAHDDNTGPFVQYDIDNDGYISPLRDYLPEGDSKDKWEVIAAITALPHSVRIYPYECIHEIMLMYDRFLALKLCSSNQDLSSYTIDNSEDDYGKFSPPQWTAKIWDSRDYKQALVDYVRGDVQAYRKLDLSQKKRNGASLEHLIRVQVCNLPKQIMVLHARKEIEHDVILDLSVPWDTEMFVHVIPFSGDAENHLNRLTKLAEISLSNQNDNRISIDLINLISLIGPILSYILKFFGKQDTLTVD